MMGVYKLSENPLKSRDDVQRNLIELLAPLEDHIVPGGYLLGDTAAHYAPKVALMEGFSRTLWGIGPLVAGSGPRAYSGLAKVLSILKEGVNPASPGYWGKPGGRDQRLVEMASISLALIIARDVFWDPLSPEQQTRLYTWLATIQDVEVPPSNWLFFRILVCTAFHELGLPVNEKVEQESFDRIEACYRGEGWYEDGLGGAYDFYNPSGFHFYGLLYAKLAGHRDPGRAARYVERAKLFAAHFAAWFREDGSAIPYGRSLTYRFTPISFYSACAFADLPVLPWGVLKGMVLRNLRQWFSRPILDSGGILSIGYGYPNLIMADTYNSPGSPYWGLKAWLILALGPEHPFWTSKEEPWDDETSSEASPGKPHEARIIEEKIPGFILSRTKEDAQLFAPGVFTGFEMNHAAQKYGKFAYSARFGFCVSHGGHSIEGSGCDSMLILSEGDGYWRERRRTEEVRTGPNWVSAVWKPWPDVRIETKVISLGDWHLRIHRIESARALLGIEGGFAIKRFHGYEEAAPVNNVATGEHEALVLYPWGASRIAALEEDSHRTGTLVVPPPNLNVLYPQTVIPCLEGKLDPGLTVWACAVRAGDRETVVSENTPLLYTIPE
jgi:hypothetical protein